MQNYTFFHTTFSHQQLTGHIVSNNSSETLGTYEMYVRDETFLAVINIFPDYQKAGIGFNAFKFCYDILSKSNTLNCFLASWHKDNEYSHLPNGSSVNLTKFIELIDLGYDSETSLWQTPTGKWLKRLGFNKAGLTHKSIDTVRATFYKQSVV